MKKNLLSKLAIDGGVPIRQEPLPPRKIFGEDELKMVKAVFEDSWKSGVDFNFQGKFEEKFTKAFCDFQGGKGFADAVCSGGAAVYIALKALNIKAGSDVIVSPVTNPGGIMPVAVQDFKLIVPDSNPNSFNISPEEFEKSITAQTRAAVLTHLGGHPIDMNPIMEIAKSRNIKIVEDCAQAHGALYRGERVGTFGEVAAFSNGFSKTLAAGGVAGLVYTKNEDLYWKIRSIADRGKPFHKPNFNFRMTTDFLFPSHNFNADELSCAIGMSVLSKLKDIIKKRHEIAKKIDLSLKASKVISPSNLELPNCSSSIFFHTVTVDTKKISVSKVKFASAVAAEGIAINGDYRDVTCEWPWMQNHVRMHKKNPHAINFRDRTFNILFNEKYGEKEIKNIIDSILKVEKFYIK